MSTSTVSTYCYQCVNGPDMLAVEVTDGVATTVTPNFAAKGYHPADSIIKLRQNVRVIGRG